MAHFAQINQSNIVLQVIVISDDDAPDPAPYHSEPYGQAFIHHILKLPGTWKQTSYNGSFRKNYAGIGYTYDEVRDAFIPPKPYNSWILNEDTCLWEPPLPYPSDGNLYDWDEEEQMWVITDNPVGQP
jgi:hypothetical protein